MSAIPDACATRRGPIRLRFAALILLTIALIPACASRIAPTPENTPSRVLFVGNSLTYVGNTPAIYAALVKANGHPVTADMIVRGGATLTQRVADGSVAAALETGEYTALVLQERGGDLMCAFGPASCVESRAALKLLAGLGRQHGVSVILLGSYQPHPWSSLITALAAAPSGRPPSTGSHGPGWDSSPQAWDPFSPESTGECRRTRRQRPRSSRLQEKRLTQSPISSRAPPSPPVTSPDPPNTSSKQSKTGRKKAILRFDDLREVSRHIVRRLRRLPRTITRRHRTTLKARARFRRTSFHVFEDLRAVS